MNHNNPYDYMMIIWWLWLDVDDPQKSPADVHGGVFQCQAARGYGFCCRIHWLKFLAKGTRLIYAEIFPKKKSASLVSEMISAGCQEAKLILTLPSIETSTSKLSWIGAVCTTYNSHDDSAVYLYASCVFYPTSKHFLIYYIHIICVRVTYIRAC